MKKIVVVITDGEFTFKADKWAWETRGAGYEDHLLIVRDDKVIGIFCEWKAVYEDLEPG